MSRAGARRTPTNLSVRSDLVQRARELHLNMSRVLEEALERVIREHERAAWLAENKTAIEEYAALVAKHGLFSDDWRRF